ncbi:MAG: hypothetical protein HC817_07740 [Saprospiraceae bacterium]|nr:hypothetical protein [Saprospiraceae bacterium]
MKKLLITVGLSLSLFTACDDFNLEKVRENPNDVSVENSDLNLLMNKIQLDFADS